MEFTDEQVKKYETFLKYHLGKNFDELDQDQKRQALNARDRRFNLLMIINIAALLFFGYWFLAEVTQLPDLVLYILLAVFVLNMLSVVYQKKMLKEVQTYVESQ